MAKIFSKTLNDLLSSMDLMGNPDEGKQSVNSEYNSLLKKISSSQYRPLELEGRPIVINKNEIDKFKSKYKNQDKYGLNDLIRTYLRLFHPGNQFNSDIGGKDLLFKNSPLNHILNRMPSEENINKMQRDYADMDFRDKNNLDPQDKAGYGWGQYVLPNRDIFPKLQDEETKKYIQKGFPNVATTKNETTGKNDYNDIRTYRIKDKAGTNETYLPYAFLDKILTEFLDDKENKYSIGGNSLWTVTKDPTFTYEQGYDAGDYTHGLQFDDKGNIKRNFVLDTFNFDKGKDGTAFFDKYFGNTEIPGLGMKVKDMGSPIAKGLLSLVGGIDKTLGINITGLADKDKIDDILQKGGKPYTMYGQGLDWEEVTKLYRTGQLTRNEKDLYEKIDSKRIKAFEKFQNLKKKSK